MKKTRLLTGWALTLIMAGCAAPTMKVPPVTKYEQREEARKQIAMASRRTPLKMRKNEKNLDPEKWLNEIAYQIYRANAEFCDKTRFISGFSWESRPYLYKGALGDRAAYVLQVYEDSPAEKAGLKEGDRIIRINGHYLGTSGAGAKNMLENHFRQGGMTNQLVVDRGGTRKGAPAELVEISVGQTRNCDYPVHIKPDSKVNAYTDGKKIVFTTGLLKFADTSEELAFVLSHELAHIIEKHVDKSKANTFIGAGIGAAVGAALGVLLDAGLSRSSGGKKKRTTNYAERLGTVGMAAGAIKGRLAYSPEFEGEADYIGVYLMGRAGYELDNVAGFWRRMGAKHPQAIMHSVTHQPTAKRFVAVEKAVREFQWKQSRGERLIPEKKAFSTGSYAESEHGNEGEGN